MTVELEHWPRAAWTSYRPALQAMPVPKRHVWIHHTVGRLRGHSRDQFAQFLRETEAFHINSRGMRAGAYNGMPHVSLAIDADFRGWGIVGGHTLNWNSNSHAVVAPGNFDEDRAPDSLIVNIGNAIVRRIAEGFVDRNPIIGGHRDSGFSTACPGRHLYARLDDIRQIVAQGGAGTPTTPSIPTFDLQSGDLGMDGIFYGNAFHVFYVNEKGQLMQRAEEAAGAPGFHGPLLEDCAKGAEARVKVIDPVPEPRNDAYGFAVAALASDGSHARVVVWTGAPRNQWVKK